MTTKQVSVLRLVPMICIMGTIFFLSHQPGDSLYYYPIPGLDKVAHLLIYGLLAGSIIFGFSSPYRAANVYKVIFITISISLLYGISDEIHQAFIPNRYVSIADVLADLSGSILACLIWYSWGKWMVRTE